jgi:YVTN family beta-propeller protein
LAWPILAWTGWSALTVPFAAAQPTRFDATTEAVGPTSTHRAVTPVHQVLTPLGRQVPLPKLRPQALALSPDGRRLVTAGKTAEIVVLDPVSGAILERVPLPSDKTTEPSPDAVSTHILEPDKEGQVSFTGLVFSPDGRRLYLANVNGSIKVFKVDSAGSIAGLFSIPLPPANAPRREAEIPSGLAVSRDGRRLYVVLNLGNGLAELDALTGRLLRRWDVGVAPYDVVLVGDKAYVSNWGGRRPGADAPTGPAGRGTRVRVDPVRHIASEGSVSVIDLTRHPQAVPATQPGAAAAPALPPAREILVGLHASGIAVTPDRRYLAVANASSDTVSVIDARTDRVVETIGVKSTPADLFGASPNALAFDASGRRLYVCNGTLNAVAVVEFNPGESVLAGLLPVGWFPGAILVDSPRKSLYVANIKGLGPGRPNKKTLRPEFNSHQYHGSLSLVPVPARRELARHSQAVLANCRAPLIEAARQPSRPNQPARAIPERVGEPSLLKHVVYVIKENRTYDQVLGDIPEGNGDPNLCIFGEDVTPNQHRLVRQFVLLDNTYCCGILSADGHQWSTTGFATDYMEKSFAGFPRSYPDGMGEDEADALAYSPGGFIWDNALRHGLSVRDYGEFMMPVCGWADAKRKGSPAWLDFWDEFKTGRGEVVIGSQPSIETIRPLAPTNYVGWEMAVPDVWRARFITNELRRFEAQGELPRLILICLPDDHTSGTAKGSPTPAACVADNDLAFGQIVEAFSHSRFWKETAIFAIEDDPQGGWDHVSGYRTTAYVASPYARRHAVVSTQFNTTSILRTIELILGLPPMNLIDATATPLADCFTDTPDLTPFVAVPNRVPLDQMNPDPKTISDRLLRRHALASARLPLRAPDRCPEDLLNRILWHARKGPHSPYPSWAVNPAAGADDDE